MGAVHGVRVGDDDWMIIRLIVVGAASAADSSLVNRLRHVEGHHKAQTASRRPLLVAEHGGGVRIAC